jgi:hypothetical protein
MKISGYGIVIDLPSGWEGRVYRRPEGFPILHAANFPLPAGDGDFGSRAVASMSRDGVFAVLAEYDPGVLGEPLFEEQGLPLPLRPAEASPKALQRMLRDRSGLHKFFTVVGRPFSLYVVVGSSPGVGTLVERANHVLATLSIEPRAQG